MAGCFQRKLLLPLLRSCGGRATIASLSFNYIATFTIPLQTEPGLSADERSERARRESNAEPGV